MPYWYPYPFLNPNNPELVPPGYAGVAVYVIGIAIVACLSYNMLLGQGGMLSFGHAVYSGLGAYLAIHALAAVNRGALVLPVSLVPLVGGLAGLGCALVLGFLACRRGPFGHHEPPSPSACS